MINTIAPLVTGLFLWFKADSFTGLTSGTPVARWADSSSSLLDATIQRSDLQPVFQANSINGKPALRFSGGQRLSTPPLQLFHQGIDSLTLFLVFKPNLSDSSSCLIHKSSINPAATLEVALELGPRAFGSIGIDRNFQDSVTSSPEVILPSHSYISVISFAATGSTPDNIAVALNSNNIRVTKNGRGWLDSGNYPTDASPLDIGACLGDGFFNGEIAEILAFSHQLSEKDLARVGCYLGRKYRLDEALPWCSL